MARNRKRKAKKDQAHQKPEPEATPVAKPVVTSPPKEITMNLSTQQDGLINTITMQAMAFGLQVGNEGSDTAHMTAIKRDLHKAIAHQRKPGLKCYEAITHHLATLGEHIAKVDRDIKNTPTSRQRPLLERKSMLSLMHAKLEVAENGFDEFAPAPVEETPTYIEDAQEEKPTPDTASAEEPQLEGDQDEDEDTTD